VAADTPPDWYPDPVDPAQERWWNGEEWTTDIRRIRTGPLAAPAPSRRPPRAALLAAGALGLLTILVVTAVIVLTGGDRSGDIDDLPVAGDAETGTDDADEDTADGDADDGAAGDDDTAGEGDGDAGEGDGDADDSGSEGADGEETTDEDDPADAGDGGVIDLDGQCEVDLDEVPDADGDLRAWDVPACTYAPVDLGSGSRWIVVIASLDGTANDGPAAETRADGFSGAEGVLWSSHYPSLNPGWWVVYDGPFDGQDAATEAAEARGGGAYPRLLSDDTGDRYCIAAGGCEAGGD
jgi:hypothetical protein